MDAGRGQHQHGVNASSASLPSLQKGKYFALISIRKKNSKLKSIFGATHATVQPQHSLYMCAWHMDASRLTVLHFHSLPGLTHLPSSSLQSPRHSSGLWLWHGNSTVQSEDSSAVMSEQQAATCGLGSLTQCRKVRQQHYGPFYISSGAVVCLWQPQKQRTCGHYWHQEPGEVCHCHTCAGCFLSVQHWNQDSNNFPALRDMLRSVLSTKAWQCRAPLTPLFHFTAVQHTGKDTKPFWGHSIPSYHFIIQVLYAMIIKFITDIFQREWNSHKGVLWWKNKSKYVSATFIPPQCSLSFDLTMVLHPQHILSALSSLQRFLLWDTPLGERGTCRCWDQ